MNQHDGKVFVCGYILFFQDGGPPEEQVLHRGTLEECERVGQVCLAVTYSGSRPLEHARFVIGRVEP